ncbi:MAG: DNA polymerase III subunit gamma and tau [Actinomycetota bacterium]|nr:DNA polymerase III subunit gamma and tau [Actinomycetota bacterium]
MTAPTALYRRYRPDSFADVIGQEHVTDPLMAALQKNRVNHAYLFSGPRGCGKTTSARILARCLNCAQGPTAVPCGQCDSCIELARGGSGSLDVIEIDAASHGGVDDARDLRERATFAPVRDRYKIFIIDEAHMVTSAGFNALLKIVEEPPEHIKFIFATTEPDKVIGTIRSRTHHYPFRLVPPEPLMAYLGQLCGQENVPVAPGVISLVIRAGGGSVRDSLSVLDQLMAGAGPAGLDYELAVSLLGYTHASLLDDVVEALAAADAATVFKTVDRVIQTGHDPRRFVEDLLERFRDLIIVQAMPESAHAILRGTPEDQISRMQTQATQLGAAELSRAADVTNSALTEMTGATSPRLHLELLSARLLLPGADQSERGMATRLDRIERRLSYGVADAGAAAAGSAAPGPGRTTASPTTASGPAVPPVQRTAEGGARAEAPAPAPSVQQPPASTSGQPAPSEQPARSGPPARSEQPAQSPQAAGGHTAGRPKNVPAAASDSSSGAPSGHAAQPSSGGAGNGVEVLRRAWPEILDNLAKVKRSSWALVAPNATPQSFDGDFLQLAFSTEGLAGAFSRGDHADNLRSAINTTLGISCRVKPVVGGPSASSSSSEPDPKAPTNQAYPATAASSGAGVVAAPQGHTPQPVVSAAAAPADAPSLPDAAPPTRPASGQQTTVQQGTPPSRDTGPEEPPYSDEEPPPEWDAPPPETTYPSTPRRATPPETADPSTPRRATPPAPAEPGWGAISEAPDWATAAPAASTAAAGSKPAPVTVPPSDASEPGQRKMSRYERLTNSPEAQAGRASAPERKVDLPYVEDIPSADDETIEESGLIGRAAVERILGGRLIEERSVNGS